MEKIDAARRHCCCAFLRCFLRCCVDARHGTTDLRHARRGPHHDALPAQGAGAGYRNPGQVSRWQLSGKRAYPHDRWHFAGAFAARLSSGISAVDRRATLPQDGCALQSDRVAFEGASCYAAADPTLQMLSNVGSQRTLPVRQRHFHHRRRLRDLLSMPLRKLPERHRIRTCGQSLFLNGKPCLDIREDKVRSFTLAGTRHTKAFCTECGSALPNLQMDGKLLVVPAEVWTRPSP